MTSNSTRKKRQRKSKIDRPPKPYPDFPLSPANCGSWQKKINGKIHYFGKWGKVVNGKLVRIQPDGGWQAASELYEQRREAIYANRKVRVKSDELTLKDLCNRYRYAKEQKMNAGRITAGRYSEIISTTDLLIAQFGKDRPLDDLEPVDFEKLLNTMTKRWGPVRLGNAITNVKSVFIYGFKNGILKDDPKKLYGSEFEKPDKSELLTASGKERGTNDRKSL